ITIYDLTGREIWRSIKSNYPAGNYTITWNGVNQAGESVVSGIYLVRIITPKYAANQRILLMK
ncbi:MAG: T9SS type A sorting domain-containing protein, partial [Candidatus Marinimicrobia bacterium]|nr:T9SS type A sorting domain-containing protein [Candidatus Neomarinimicrobiota bacterium]